MKEKQKLLKIDNNLFLSLLNNVYSILFTSNKIKFKFIAISPFKCLVNLIKFIAMSRLK